MVPQSGLPALPGSLRLLTLVGASGLKHGPRYEPVRPHCRGARDEGCRARPDCGGVVGDASCGRHHPRRLLWSADAFERGPGDAGGGRPDPLYQRACLPPCSRTPSICSRLVVRPALIRVPKPYDPTLHLSAASVAMPPQQPERVAASLAAKRIGPLAQGQTSVSLSLATDRS
jgi:hypothetical protein